MNMKELKIARVASIGGREFNFKRNDLDLKLEEVEWEGARPKYQDLFEKLIEPVSPTADSSPTTMQEELPV
jgi:hypothetical protein